MKIIPLSEGSFTIDKTKVFIPFDKSTDKLQDRAVGSLLVEILKAIIVIKLETIHSCVIEHTMFREERTKRLQRSFPDRRDVHAFAI